MRAVVVYQSLWGNTAAIAHAIAEGLGADTIVGDTSQITPEQAAQARLLIVGSPVHALRLPTAESIESVRERPVPVGDLEPRLDGPLLSDWIAALAPGDQAAAAFDTRVRGPFGRGGTSSIEKALKARGRSIVAKGQGFAVTTQRSVTAPATMLRAGELDRARQWGATLA